MQVSDLLKFCSRFRSNQKGRFRMIEKNEIIKEEVVFFFLEAGRMLWLTLNAIFYFCL